MEMDRLLQQHCTDMPCACAQLLQLYQRMLRVFHWPVVYGKRRPWRLLRLGLIVDLCCSDTERRPHNSLATLCIEHIFSCPVWRALWLLRLCVGGKLLLQVLHPALLCVFATRCAGGIRCTDSHACRILSRCLLNAVPAAFGLLHCFSLHSNPLDSHVRFLLLHCFAFCASTSLLP